MPNTISSWPDRLIHTSWPTERRLNSGIIGANEIGRRSRGHGSIVAPRQDGLGVMDDRGLKPTATFGGRSATKDKNQRIATRPAFPFTHSLGLLFSTSARQKTRGHGEHYVHKAANRHTGKSMIVGEVFGLEPKYPSPVPWG